MGNFGASIATVIGLFVGLALTAVLVSKNANTSSVITSAGTAISNIIGAAVKPVSG
jgi:hypothetical protein